MTSGSGRRDAHVVLDKIVTEENGINRERQDGKKRMHSIYTLGLNMTNVIAKIHDSNEYWLV